MFEVRSIVGGYPRVSRSVARENLTLSIARNGIPDPLVTRPHPCRAARIPHNLGFSFSPQKQFPMKTYQCIVCGFVYDEAQGIPSEGIAPGTKWEDVPDTWLCPDCGVGKSDFEMVEI